jgi:drug/metabolite transporter (DMT)-like permease
LTDLAEPLPGVPPATRRHPATGYLLYLVAALLFALNGVVAKTLLLGGMEASRLSQLRATLAFLILLGFVALTRRSALRLRRAEIPLLVAYGVLGIALTQFLYFAAIERLPIGVALLIEFTAPLMIAIWFRFGLGHATKPAVWGALVAALVGLAIVAQVWEGLTLDPLGVAFAVGAAVALAVYYITADMQVQRPEARDPVSLTMWGMGAAALFWAIVLPRTSPALSQQTPPPYQVAALRSRKPVIKLMVKPSTGSGLSSSSVPFAMNAWRHARLLTCLAWMPISARRCAICRYCSCETSMLCPAGPWMR